MYRGGDCDDLSILLSSLMESAGIETAFLTIPGHIYMAFDLGLAEEEARKSFYAPGELIFHGGKAWVPLEITIPVETPQPAVETSAPAAQGPAAVAETPQSAVEAPAPAALPPETAVSGIEQKAETPAVERKSETPPQEAPLSPESPGSPTERPPARKRSPWALIRVEGFNAGIGAVCAAALLAIAGLKRRKK